MNAHPRYVEEFDETVDVVVVGYGFAGAVSAISAHDAGASVLLLEKMADPGGISVCAGGGLRLSRDKKAAFDYLKATNDGTTPDNIIQAFVDEMFTLEGFLEELVKVNDHKSILLMNVTDMEAMRAFMTTPEMKQWDEENGCVDIVYSMERIN